MKLNSIVDENTIIEKICEKLNIRKGYNENVNIVAFFCLQKGE